jgi:hypothetical protein
MTSKREDIFTPEQLADFDYEKEHAPKRRRWYSLRIGITKTERFEAVHRTVENRASAAL